MRGEEAARWGEKVIRWMLITLSGVAVAVFAYRSEFVGCAVYAVMFVGECWIAKSEIDGAQRWTL